MRLLIVDAEVIFASLIKRGYTLELIILLKNNLPINKLTLKNSIIN